MSIRPFRLERYFAQHEFTARYLLSASDCESITLPELLALGDDETRGLWERLWLGYTESQGHPLLREEIARQYERVSGRDVLVAAPEESIFLAMHALLEPGDEVIVTWPAYQSLTDVASSLGCRVVRWALRLDGSVWRLDINELAHLVTPRTRLLVVNFPHNPTGYLPSREEWRDIVGVASRHSLHLFSDEMYRLLEEDTEARLAPGCDIYERGITLSGLSKSYGLPGLRIGWLATQDAEVLDRCQAMKDYTTICSSAPSEILAIVALRARESIVSRNRAIITRNLGLADRFFAEHAEEFVWPRPVAGPVAFPRLTMGETVSKWCERLLLERELMVVPGEMFEHGGDHFRIGLGRENLAEALERLF